MPKRLVHKLDAFTDPQPMPAQPTGAQADLALLRRSQGVPRQPRESFRLALRTRIRSHLPPPHWLQITLDRLLARLHASKDELLMVLDRPDTPKLGSAPR